MLKYLRCKTYSRFLGLGIEVKRFTKNHTKNLYELEFPQVIKF